MLQYRRHRFQWVGKGISDAQMERLFNLRKQTQQPITGMVHEAVDRFLAEEELKMREIEAYEKGELTPA